MSETIEAEVIAPVKRKAGRPKGVKRAVSKLRQHEIALITTDYARGMKQTEIAKKFGVSDASVSMILAQFKPLFAELGNVESYRQVKSDIIDAASLTVLKEIVNPSKVEQADLRALACSYDILNKHSRLERGESTSNVSTQSIQVTVSGDDYRERQS
jgi:hypothetical protein